jgi:hypothetical protein
MLTQLLDGFDETASGAAMPDAECGPDAVDRARANALAAAVMTARLAVRGIAALTEGGVRERLGARMRPQPMVRSMWR